MIGHLAVYLWVGKSESEISPEDVETQKASDGVKKREDLDGESEIEDEERGEEDVEFVEDMVDQRLIWGLLVQQYLDICAIYFYN